jgi:hypothetical protein
MTELPPHVPDLLAKYAQPPPKPEPISFDMLVDPSSV